MEELLQELAEAELEKHVMVTVGVVAANRERQQAPLNTLQEHAGAGVVLHVFNWSLNELHRLEAKLSRQETPGTCSLKPALQMFSPLAASSGLEL